MQIETILQILYNNGLENVVSLAVQLDNNILVDSEYAIGQDVIAEVHNDDIKHLGIKFKRSSYGNFPVKLIGYNKYVLEKKYLVELPSGKKKWVTSDKFNREIDETMEIETVLSEQ